MTIEALLARYEEAARNLDAARKKLQSDAEIVAKLELNTAWRKLYDAAGKNWLKLLCESRGGNPS
ncbi:MAG: hypothetical protein KGL39_18150 [Patescibacteria group bacterium]|nr:hypothetical protein [Patescibacteria group bacterium]